MNMKEMVFDVNKELNDYLQKLGKEVDAKTNLIDYMMTSHKDDPSFIESEVFKKYEKNYEEKLCEYNLAKEEMNNYIIPLIKKELGTDDFTVNWNIKDFSELKVYAVVTF